MSDSSDAETFAELFRDVYLRFHRRVRPEAYRPRGESLAVLRHLRASGPLTVTEAARHFTRSQAAMSEIVARLEQRGFVERMRDERDRRRTLVWLSKPGLVALDDAERVFSTRLVEHAFAQLAPEDRAKILEGLATLLATDPAEEGWDA